MEEQAVEIRLAQPQDRNFWFRLDRHLRPQEWERKLTLGQCYVLTVAGVPAGVLRYNLFWDNTPFCTLLFLDEPYRRRGLGRRLMRFWEDEMRALGYETVLTSTQANEDAQHFYRRLGYRDCGCLLLGEPAEPMELFLCRRL